MKRQNCWEFNNCGRQHGGCNVAEMGVCPSSIASEFKGVNHGDNAGRFCWTVVGSLCKGKVQGTFAQKLKNCLDCNFFKQVKTDEGEDFRFSNFDVRKQNLKKDKTDLD